MKYDITAEEHHCQVVTQLAAQINGAVVGLLYYIIAVSHVTHGCHSTCNQFPVSYSTCNYKNYQFNKLLSELNLKRCLFVPILDSYWIQRHTSLSFFATIIALTLVVPFLPFLPRNQQCIHHSCATSASYVSPARQWIALCTAVGMLTYLHMPNASENADQTN